MLFARAKDSQTWLVVGLGNPGTKYQNTRHNIGQLALDALAGDNKYEKHKSGMLVCTKKLGEVKLLLAKSTGFMNETGVPTKSLASFYKISSNNLVAIHDELDLPFNSLRTKVGGSDNGHNGLKSLTTHFGADYYRIRLGLVDHQIKWIRQIMYYKSFRKVRASRYLIFLLPQRRRSKPWY